jgi:hypothetical protein
MQHKKTCNLRIEFHPSHQKNIAQLRSSNGRIKRRTMHFILELYNEGYRHFVIYLLKPSDLWVAEIIYFLSISYRESELCYSIGLWLDDEDSYQWLNTTEMFRREVFQNARHVFLRSEKWYDNYCQLKYLYVNK